MSHCSEYDLQVSKRKQDTYQIRLAICHRHDLVQRLALVIHRFQSCSALDLGSLLYPCLRCQCHPPTACHHHQDCCLLGVYQIKKKCGNNQKKDNQLIVKGALDNFNIIYWFFEKKKKKVEILVWFDLLLWQMNVCKILLASSILSRELILSVMDAIKP